MDRIRRFHTRHAQVYRSRQLKKAQKAQSDINLRLVLRWQLVAIAGLAMWMTPATRRKKNPLGKVDLGLQKANSGFYS
jgi:hypothetical protein